MFIENNHITIEEQKKNVCLRIKEIREQKKLSQLELSLASNVSQNMIAYIETGKRTPTLTTILKLCKALNVNPATLFQETNTETEKVKKQLHEYIDKYVR